MTKGVTAATYLLGKNSSNPTDYYTQESTGTVYDPNGLLAEFGLQNGSQIDPGHFEKLCGGYSPITGDPLLKQHGDQHRAGTDFAFAPPKSFSVLWAIADDEFRARLEQINQDAVRVGLDHLNEQATSRAGKQGAQTVKATFAAVQFQHGSNRDGDPQLHIHNAILNLTKNQAGEWKTIEPRTLFKWQTSADALYQAQLISVLQREFGVSITKSENGHSFEIDSVSSEITKHWSGRREEMVRKATELGISIDDAGGMDRINFATRKAKDILDNPHQGWRDEASKLGFGQAEANSLLLSSSAAEKSPLSAEEVRQRVIQAINDIHEIDSVISDNQLHRAIGEAFFGELDADQIKSLISDLKDGMDLYQRDKVVFLGYDDGMAQYTTQSMRATERSLFNTSKSLSEDAKHEISHVFIEESIDAVGFLSDEQKDLVRHLTSPGSLKIGEGSAGSGKSTSTLAAVNAFKSEGYEVQGLAMSWSAAKVLEHDAKINSRAIAGYLNDIYSDKIKLNEKSVLVIDEAGLIGSKDTERLVHAVQKVGAKIIFLGEESQLSPVSAGPAMGIMIESSGAQSIQTIRRQQDGHERQMVIDFRDGRSDLALDHLQKQGRLTFHKNSDTTKKQLIRDWEAYTHANPTKSSLILAVKNDDVRVLNVQVREILKRCGEVHAKDFDIKTAGLNKSVQTLSFASGDQIILKKTDLDLGVTNNTLAKIENIRETAAGGHELTVRTTDGKQIKIDTLQYKNPDSGGVAIRHGYAVTAWSAQGATVDRSFVLGEGMDRRYAYVSMSRHRQAASLYINSEPFITKLKDAGQDANPHAQFNELAKQLHRKGIKQSTLDYEDGSLAAKKDKTKQDMVDLMSRLNTRNSLDEALDKLQGEVNKAEEKLRQAYEQARIDALGNVQVQSHSLQPD